MLYPFSKIVEELKDSIIVVDPSGFIEYINTAFLVVTGWSQQDVIGFSLNEFIPGSLVWHQQALYKSQLDMQLTFKTIDNQFIPVKLNHFMEFNGGESVFTIFMFRDVSHENELKLALDKKDGQVSAELHQQSQHLKMMHKAILKSYADTRQACGALLKVGCDIMGMELGIVSHVQENIYEVMYVNHNNLDVHSGAEFEVNNTYCKPVIYHKKPYTYNHVGAESSMRGHPVYEALRLESYIGVPLFINHDFYGTLNFSSRAVRQLELNQRDIEMIQLLAQVIERLLERDFSEKREQALMQRLQKLSIMDELTQVHNRRKLNEDLKYEIQRAKRHNINISILLIDIDNFKTINDTFGHIRGDNLLVEFAQIMKQNIRHIDRFYRYGGEEFVAILPGATSQEAQVVAKKLLACSRNNIILDDKPMTASIGITQFVAEDTLESFIHRADKALYQAKHSGKDCYHVI